MSKKKKKIRNLRLKNSDNRSSKFIIPKTPDFNDMPIIFSLEKVIGDDYCFSKLSNEDKRFFAESIYKRRKLKWKDLLKMDRHGLGPEKIKRSQIKKSLPKEITEDVEYFLAFRYSGKKSMVGYRVDNIFFVLWFDHNFTLYKH